MANIVTLAEVKQFMRYPSSQWSSSPDDTALQWFINAADVVIESECDVVLPKLFSEHYDGGDTSIFLRHIPVLEVSNVEEGWGWLAYELDFVEVNSPGPDWSLYAYSLDSPSNGEITRRSAGNVVIPFRPGDSNIFVQYRAGYEPTNIPGNLFLAELQLIQHWWKNSQYRAESVAGSNIAYDATSGQVYTRDTEAGTQNLNIGVPVAILSMIKNERRRPIIA